jgi:Tol biopolymer transport system component
MKRFLDEGLQVQTFAAYWSGDYLVFAAAQGANVNLWRALFEVRYPTHPGSAQRLTFGAAFETGPWVADNGTIAFENHRGLVRIWSFALHGADAQTGERITQSADLDAFPSISSDGRWLAFTRSPAEKGIRQIWLRDLPSGNESMMTSDAGAKSNPVISPAGDLLAYSVAEGAGNSIYVMTCATRRTRRLCQQCGFASSWMPGGDGLLASARGQIDSISVTTGSVTPALARSGLLLDEAEISPDRKWIAFSTHAPEQERRVYVAPYGTPGEWLPAGPASGWSDKPHWSVDGRTLFFYSDADGHPCIWSRAVDGQFRREARALHHFHNARLDAESISQPIRNFAVAKDRMFLDLAERSGSIWMAFPQR